MHDYNQILHNMDPVIFQNEHEFQYALYLQISCGVVHANYSKYVL